MDLSQWGWNVISLTRWMEIMHKARQVVYWLVDLWMLICQGRILTVWQNGLVGWQNWKQWGCTDFFDTEIQGAFYLVSHRKMGKLLNKCKDGIAGFVHVNHSSLLVQNLQQCYYAKIGHKIIPWESPFNVRQEHNVISSLLLLSSLFNNRIDATLKVTMTILNVLFVIM